MTSEEKVDQLFTKYYSYLMVKALGILNSHEIAEDAVQETFIRVVSHHNLNKIDEVDSKRTKNFLLKTLTNIALTKWKENIKTYHFEFHEDMYQDGLETSKDPTWDIFKALEQTDFLKRQISKLSKQDQDLLAYRFFYDFSYKEIAELMGVSVNYATTRVSRIRKKIENRII